MKHAKLAFAFVGLLIGIADTALVTVAALQHLSPVFTVPVAVSAVFLIINYGLESIQ